jgi:hypothetical protein
VRTLFQVTKCTNYNRTGRPSLAGIRTEEENSAIINNNAILQILHDPRVLV